VGGDLDWDDLRYFLHAARAGTLAGAAQKLGVRHTTVGRRLSSLERTLGAPLFLRSPDGLALTRFGERLLPFAERVEEAALSLRQEVTVQQPRVRLAVPSGFTSLFTAALEDLRRESSTLTLELVSGARPVDLHKGEADLAVRHGPVHDPDLVAKSLGTSGWSLYGAETYLARRPAPADIDDLRGHEMIGYDASLAAMPASQWVEAHAEQVTIVMRSREMTDMLAAALSGVGLAVLPCLLGDAEPKLRRLTERVVATRELWLVFRREARGSQPVRLVARFVGSTIQKNAGRISGSGAGAESIEWED
jgi:DNA-binding transcriptional LysR family regulator